MPLIDDSASGSFGSHMLTDTPSFHSRVGKVARKPTRGGGFPIPGEQNPTADMVMSVDYFSDGHRWAQIQDKEVYDYIVVGSGCTALAFIDETLRQDPSSKILCLERGDFLLPSHFQNLPLPFKMVLGGPSETFPWTLSRKTFEDPYLGYVHGSCPFFGGRSTFWSAWSPTPTEDEMRGFTPEMIEITKEKEFWEKGERLLNVTAATDINDGLFSGLQDEIDERLKMPEFAKGDKSPPLPHIPSATRSFSAPLSVGRRSPTSTLRFNKFSTPGPLLGWYESQRKKHLANSEHFGRMDIMLNCVVKSLDAGDDGIVRSMETSRGTLSWQDRSTKVILCAGAFPAATILLNSFPEQCAGKVGSRVTGHFLSHIVARIPVADFGKWRDPIERKDQPSKLEIAAHYLAGEHPKTKQQYHVQITAIHSPNPEEDVVDAARECPDYAAAATADQLAGSEKHVVFVCATLGEFEEHNPENYFKPDPKNKDITTNMKLQMTLTQNDRDLWNLMEEATFQTIEEMALPGDAVAHEQLEYWWDSPKGGGEWKKERPTPGKVRIPGIVHEASTAYVGRPDDGSAVDVDGRPHGIENVHVTGAALFPTAGSWNPTLAMCAFTQRLAKKLAEEKTGKV